MTEIQADIAMSVVLFFSELFEPAINKWWNSALLCSD
jgi:hypothetical protein